MQFRYGGYRHDENAVQLRSFRTSTQHENGRAVSATTTLDIEGTVKGSSQNELHGKIRALEEAYGQSVDTAGLFHDNGSPTRHLLTSSGSLGGIQVVDIGWLDGPAEYATQRTFVISLRTENTPRNANNLRDFNEAVAIQGTGGARRVVSTTVSGYPVRHVVAKHTPILITQSGSATGLTTRPKVPPPLFPSDEDVELRSITEGSDNEVSWSYSFTKLRG